MLLEVTVWHRAGGEKRRRVGSLDCHSSRLETKKAFMK